MSYQSKAAQIAKGLDLMLNADKREVVYAYRDAIVSDVGDIERELNEARDGWHMANGVADLAMKHRDEAEAKLAAMQQDYAAANVYATNLERDLAAANAKLAVLERENSKLRSALEIVHFKQEPWQ